MSEDRLSKAYRLIEADELGAARAILQPLIDAESVEPDVWWLYAHAVTDPDEARAALEQVVRLDPQYPGAQALIDTFTTGTLPPAAPVVRSITPIGSSAQTADPFPADDADLFGDLDDDGLPPDDFALDDDDALDEAPADDRRSTLRTIAIAAGLMLGVLILAIVLLPSITGTPAPSADEATSLALAQATATPSILVPTALDADAQAAETEPAFAATAEPNMDMDNGDDSAMLTATEAVSTTAAPTDDTTPEAPDATEAVADTGDDSDAAAVEGGDDTGTETADQGGGAVEATESSDTEEALTEALTAFTFDDEAVTTVETTLGRTVFANICSPADLDEQRRNLTTAMDSIAETAAGLPAEVDAVGAQLIDCDNGSVDLLRIAVSREDAAAYAQGDLSDAEYQRGWRPQ